MDEAGFQQWVARTRAQGQMLSREAYLRLAQPSERNPVQHFSDVAPGLFDAIVGRCVDPARPCSMNHARGGGPALSTAASERYLGPICRSEKDLTL